MSNLVVNLATIATEATGLTVYAKNLLPHLAPLKPTLLTSRSISGFECRSIPGNMTSDQRLKGHLRRMVWTQFVLPRLYRSLAGRLLFTPVPEAPLFQGSRFIVTVHDLIPLRFPRRTSPLTQYFRYYVPQVLQQAQHIICNSEATAADLHQFYGIPADRITPIPLAIDTDHFRLLEVLPSPRPYFLYIGRHDPYKNLARVLEAFAALPDRDCDLWLAGSTDGRYTPLLQTQAIELGIADRVQFLGYLPFAELPIVLNRAIGFVFVSLWEGFGFPVLEAMACGVPVITSNLSSLPEVAGDAALLVNPYERREITAAMQTVLSDAEARSRLRSAGITRVQQFSWTKTGAATAILLQRFL